MLLKNKSARLHHLGDVSIIPGETKEVPESFRGLYNAEELEEVSAEVLEEQKEKPAKKQKAEE